MSLTGDLIAHDLAGAEGHHAPRSDRNLDSGLGVAADPLSLVAQNESAEAGNLHVPAFRERMAHVVQNALDDAGAFGARKAELAVNDVRQVSAGQRIAG